MYLSFRAAIVRNVVVSGINCVVTLTLLLIAPLGLAAVISNTVMVTLSTLLVCTLGDVVVMWLSRGGQPLFQLSVISYQLSVIEGQQ